MRPVILFLALFAISAGLPARSEALRLPQPALLACDTLSTNPLQVHFQFGLASGAADIGLPLGLLDFRLVSPNTHVLSCSTSAPGWFCGFDASAGTISWYGPPMPHGTSLAAFDFVVDQAFPCFVASSQVDPTFVFVYEQWCFSCMGIDAVVPTKPGTWGMVKAHYR